MAAATSATRSVWLDVFRDHRNDLLWEAARRTARFETFPNTAAVERQYEEAAEIAREAAANAPRLTNDDRSDDPPVSEDRARELAAQLARKVGAVGKIDQACGESETQRRKQAARRALN